MNTATRTEWWQPKSETWPVRSATPTTEATQGSRTSFAALIAFTIILILAPQDHFDFLKPLHLAFVTGAIAGATCLLDRYYLHRTVWPRSREYVYAGLLLAWSIATVPFSLWPGGSVGVIVNVFLKAIVVFWLLGRVITTVPRLKFIAWTLTLISVLLSVSAITTFLGRGGFQNAGLAQGLARISGYNAGLTGNPNDLALMIDLILPLTLALTACTRSLWARLFLWILILLDISAVMTTYSRAGFLVAATIMILYFISLWRRGKHVLVVLVVLGCVAAIPMVPQGYIGRLATITDYRADRTGSAEERWADMKEAAVYIGRNPIIGVGIGMSDLGLNEFRGPKWKSVHDVYEQYGMDLGIPGALLFILLLYETLKGCRYAVRIGSKTPGGEELRYLSEGVWLGLAGFAVAAIFYPDAYVYDFFYIAGLAVAARTIGIHMEKQQGTVEGDEWRMTGLRA